MSTRVGAVNADSLVHLAEQRMQRMVQLQNQVDTLRAKEQLIPAAMHNDYVLLTDSLSMVYAEMGSLLGQETNALEKVKLRSKFSNTMASLKWMIDYADEFRETRITPYLAE